MTTGSAQNVAATASPPRLAERLAAHWRFKLLGGGVIVVAFFAGYALLQRFPLFAVTEMPTTGLDRLVAFRPEAVFIYLTLWLYMPISPWLLDDRRELNAYCLGLLAVLGVGLGAFLLWPTAVPRAEAMWMQHPLLRAVTRVDGLANASPSLHAASAVFSGLCNHRVLRRLGDRGVLRWLNVCWAVGILYATLATKRHVAVDLYSGVLLGAAGFGLYRWVFSATATAAGPEGSARQG
jgi:hypothetical protein